MSYTLVAGWRVDRAVFDHLKSAAIDFSEMTIRCHQAHYKEMADDLSLLTKTEKPLFFIVDHSHDHLMTIQNLETDEKFIFRPMQGQAYVQTVARKIEYGSCLPYPLLRWVVLKHDKASKRTAEIAKGHETTWVIRDEGVRIN